MRTLMLRNMYRSRRRYIGYVIAATIAVATFWTFGFVVFHPDLQAQQLPSIVVQLLVIGQVGVALFAVFFVIFFHRFLLRLRGTEFGLLVTLGMSPRQLAQLLWIESFALAAIALVLGFVVSVAETTLLIHLLRRVLEIPSLRVAFAPHALLSGILFFGLLFTVDAALCVRLTRTLTPKQLLVAARVQQPAPAASNKRVATGLACLGVAYTLALVVSSNETAGTLSVVPIVVLCAIGTYSLFRQVVLRTMTAIRKQCTSGLVLLSASRLMHRAQDYARILTIVALLSAGVLTLLSVVAGSLSYIQQQATSPGDYRAMLQIVSVTLFVSCVLSVLCFVAAASTLYVKLFTQLEQDRSQWAQLQRIGLSQRAFNRLLFAEFAVLFFAPVLVAILHSTVAIGEVTLHLIPKEATAAVRGTWLAYAVIVVGYVGIFACGCVSTWRQYTRQIARQ